uniref:phosphoethanolamine N-methyltransferase n=1 Tax=Romanomermis culicivorax TaxID=13658 RepID=A0A915JGJ1_ROMCU
MEYSEYKETEKLLSTLITLLKEDGFIQICEHTGDSLLNLSQYTNKFESHVCQDGDKFHSLSLIWEQCLTDSIYSKNDWNDHCWMLKKHKRAQKVETSSVREFLDQHQYTEFGIRSYEWIFGAGFISPGGAAQNADRVKTKIVELKSFNNIKGSALAYRCIKYQRWRVSV